jgi:hypothetical protein
MPLCRIRKVRHLLPDQIVERTLYSKSPFDARVARHCCTQILWNRMRLMPLPIIGLFSAERKNLRDSPRTLHLPYGGGGRTRTYHLRESMKMIDLSASGGLARIGADGRLMDGSHAGAQRWSAALRNHPTKPAGILYRARHDPAKLAFAIFECPTKVFQATSRGSLRAQQRGVVGRDSESLHVRLDRPLSGFWGTLDCPQPCIGNWQ